MAHKSKRARKHDPAREKQAHSDCLTVRTHYPTLVFPLYSSLWYRWTLFGEWLVGRADRGKLEITETLSRADIAHRTARFFLKNYPRSIRVFGIHEREIKQSKDTGNNVTFLSLPPPKKLAIKSQIEKGKMGFFPRAGLGIWLLDCFSTTRVVRATHTEEPISRLCLERGACNLLTILGRFRPTNTHYPFRPVGVQFLQFGL